MLFPKLPIAMLTAVKLPAPHLSTVTLPAIRLMARRCPFTLQKMLAQQLLKIVFSEALEDGDLDFLAGFTVSIEITDIMVNQQAYRVSLTRENNQLIFMPPQLSSDATIKGELSDFICLATRSEDPDTLFFQRRLCMEGDTELGLETKNLIDSVDFSQLPPWMQLAIKLMTP